MVLQCVSKEEMPGGEGKKERSPAGGTEASKKLIFLSGVCWGVSWGRDGEMIMEKYMGLKGFYFYT